MHDALALATQENNLLLTVSHKIFPLAYSLVQTLWFLLSLVQGSTHQNFNFDDFCQQKKEGRP